jgi:hypothetical protein
LSAVQLGGRVVVKLQIANEHTSQNANENFISRRRCKATIYARGSRLAAIVIEGRGGISYNLMFI